MAKATATAPNSLIQVVIVKKCDRAGHRPESNMQGALRAPAPKDGRPSPGQVARRRAGGRSARTRHSGHYRTHPGERPPPFTASARPRPTRPTRPPP